MLRKLFAMVCLLAFAGTAIFATPGSGRAQHGGGGHGGGAHFGGGHFGGHPGGFNRGAFHFSYPGYGSTYYQPYYSYYYPYYSGGYSSWGADDSAYDGLYYPDPSPFTGSDRLRPNADITVGVPTDAQVWFNDTLMTTTGPIREFYSPPLTPGKRYTYEIRARWNENGQDVTQTQEINVSPGAHINVNFPVPVKTAEQASSTKDR